MNVKRPALTIKPQKVNILIKLPYCWDSMKKPTFKLTHKALFFVAAPLRFSYECFCLKYSKEFATEVWNETINSTFPARGNFVDSLISSIMFCIFSPIIIVASILLSAPIALAEFIAGLLVILPALVTAVIALPVIGLLALGELIASLISNDDNPRNETMELSPQ